MEIKGKMNIDEYLQTEEQKGIDKILVNLLLFVLAVIPLITRTAVFQFASPVINGNILDSGTKGEVFTYYKFIWLLVAVVIMLLVFLYKMVGKGYKISFSYSNAPVFVLFLFVLLSGLFSDYKTLGMFGQYNRHDGTLTYLSYLILFLISSNIIYTEKKASMLFYALYPLVIVNVTLGILGFYGYDVLQSSFFSGLLFPSDLPRSAVQAGARFNSTINNPNYVSGIAGMMVVLFLAKAVLDKSMGSSIANLIVSILSFALLLTSLSTSGFVTFVISIPAILLVLFLSKNRKKGVFTAIAGFVAFAAVFVILNSHNSQVWNESVGFFLGSSKGGIALENTSDKEASLKKFLYDHSPFTTNVAAAANEPAPVMDEFNLPPQAWGAGTGRVYIWSKTLELIKEHPVFGYGLDTLAYFFPQDDPEKNSSLNGPDIVVDKPHNMYLGIAFGSGIIALLAFLMLIGRHAWEFAKIFRSKIETNRQIILATLFCALFSYIIQALFNDSIIGTAPIFWILLGASVSILREELAG